MYKVVLSQSISRLGLVGNTFILTKNLDDAEQATIGACVDHETSACEGASHALLEGNGRSVEGNFTEVRVEYEDSAVPAWNLLVATNRQDLEEHEGRALLDLHALEFAQIFDVHLRRKGQRLDIYGSLDGFGRTGAGFTPFTTRARGLAHSQNSVDQRHFG